MSWYEYEDGRDRRAALNEALQRRRESGEAFEPLQAPRGSAKLVRSFWGQAWCRHLESYQDYESRLPRGRSYLRQGNVYNLAIEPGSVTAQVAGSSLYDVEVTILTMAEPEWNDLQAACAGQVGSLLDLLAGKLGDGVLRVVTDPDRGLFPTPRQIRFSCNCPDWANVCKHVAAVLYGVAVKFDSDPALFFRLRGVDPMEIISAGAQTALGGAPSGGLELEDADLSALFGIDLAEPSTAEVLASPPEADVQKPSAADSADSADSGGVRPAKSAGKPVKKKKRTAKTEAGRSRGSRG
jgi:uncharacterized Zn finger protein